MSNQIHTGLYHLDTHEYDHDVAHLYEHLLIASFKGLLVLHGFSKYLFGWVGGETFHGVMFIEYGFYNPAVEALFRQYIHASKRIDETLLENELLRLQAEDEAIFEHIDKAEIRRQLKQLDSCHFVDHSETMSPVFFDQLSEQITPSVIEAKKEKKQFRELAIIFGAANMTPLEKLAFLRLTPLIEDAINDCLFQLGTYENKTSWAIGKPIQKGMIGVTIHTIRRGAYTSRQIDECVRTAITALSEDIAGHADELHYYIDGFLKTPNWATFPIDYFRYTGVMTSKKQIADAFTPEVIDSLLAKIDIRVTVATPEYWRAVES